MIATGAKDHVIFSYLRFLLVNQCKTCLSTYLLDNKLLLFILALCILTPCLIFFYALLVPNFSFNLISPIKLTSHSIYCLLFQTNLCILQDLKSWRMIWTARQNKGLYTLNLGGSLTKTTSPSIINNLSTITDYEIWHNRVEHLSDARLKILYNVDPVVPQNLERHLILVI